MTTAVAASIFPSAPKVHAADLPVWRLLPAIARSSLSFWPDRAFDFLINKNAMLGVTFVVVNDPEGVRHFLAVNAANYRRPSSVRRIAVPLAGSGLFLAEGTEWRRQRKLMAPTFTPSSINVLVPHFHEAARQLLHGVEGRPGVNLSKAFQDTALESVLRALFSMPDNQACEELSALVRGYVEGAGRPSLFDGFAASDDSFGFVLGRRRRFQSKWFAAIAAIIAKRKAEPKSADHRDLLDLLLELKDTESGDKLSDDEIRDQSATMFFAGSETTARLMFWAAHLLTLDLAEQQRLLSEIAAFPPDRVQTLEDLANWPRLRNVLLEALRLYPPLPHHLRQASQRSRHDQRHERCGQRSPLGQCLDHAPASQILAEPDRVHARPVRRQISALGANAGLYPIWRRAAHLHRTAFCAVGSADRVGASAGAVSHRPGWVAAGDANRPRHDRAGPRTDVPARADMTLT